MPGTPTRHVASDSEAQDRQSQATVEPTKAAIAMPNSAKTNNKVEYNIAFGRRLRDLRNSRQMTQAQLARALNVTPQAVQQYEAGGSTMSPEYIDLACRALQTNPLTMFGWGQVDTERLTLEDGTQFVEFMNSIDPNMRGATRFWWNTFVRFVSDMMSRKQKNE